MRVFGRIGVLLLLAACADSGSKLPDVTALSPEGVRHRGASYSPDGARVAYWSPASEGIGDELWVADADLGNASRLPVRSLVGSAPLWSPDGTLLAVVSGEFGLADVVTVPAVGGEVKRITTGAGVEIPTAWFPDGDRLSYLASNAGSLSSFVVSVTTGKTSPLVPGEKRPHVGSPSPDGAHVGYLVIEGSRSTLWVADSLGRDPRQLTTEGFESFATNRIPWSPDSKEILYESRRTGTGDLWVVPIDGGPARQLTRDIRNDFAFAESWSPDGKWVAFISDRGRQTDLWVVSSAGGEEQRVTDTRLEEQEPLWRRGSGALTYAVSSVSSGVFALELADGAERRLTPDSIRTGGFWLSPDGTQFYYRTVRGGGSNELIVSPLAGGTGRILVEAGGNVESPRWSPDGSSIVYSSDRSGTWDIWIVDAVGGASRLLVNWPTSSETNPVFSSDGSSVLFTSDREAQLSDIWEVPRAGGEPTRRTTIGSAQGARAAPGTSDFFVSVIGERAGQLGIARVRANGSVQRVWDRTNVLGFSVRPSGDSLTAFVEQSDGTQRAMLLAANGTGGRTILEPGQGPGLSSADGKSLLYYMTVNGTADMGTIDVATGVTRRLTTTPENEGGAEFTPDGRTVVFNRGSTVQRLFTSDLSKLLAAKP